MKKTDITAINQPREFKEHEMFFSITDRKGIISCCNEVFLRVAEYDPPDVLGKPHNVIRHRDMPRCVFQLLWDYLLSDRPIGAYVKNMASTGEYYWVYALAAPLGGNLYSIRIKPTSGLLPVVQDLYKELLQKEKSFGKDWREGMQAAGELLIQRLQELGFSSYDQFINRSLREELSLFDQSVKAHRKKNTSVAGASVISQAEQQYNLRGLNRVFGNLATLENLNSQIREKRTHFVSLDASLHSIAINANIKSSHLGESGKALGVVSNEIARVGAGVSVQVERLREDIEVIGNALENAGFQASMCLLQIQMQMDFRMEMATGTLTEEEQVARFGMPFKEIDRELSVAAAESYKLFMTEVTKLVGSLDEFTDFVDFLSRTVQILNFSFVTGKTLSTSIQDSEQFAGMLETLKRTSDTVYSDLGQLRSLVTQAKSQVNI